MEIFSEIEKYEMNDNIEKYSLDEAVPSKELVEKVTDTIADLVHQAKIISEENNSLVYENIDNPESYISKSDENRVRARDRYNHLKEMKESHFWTIGRNKAKVEETQNVLIDIIDAIDNNANATKALFNNQIKLAEFSKKLYGIGIMGITSNRMVVRQIKLRLENASKEELSELARLELESTVRELEKQQKLEEKIDDNQKAVNEKLDIVNNTIINNKKQHDTEIIEINESVSQLGKHVAEKLNAIKLISDSHDTRLGTLEKKSFLDSTIYKLFVGIAALGALILSVLNFLA